MRKHMKVEFFDDAVETIAAVGGFTARRPDEVVSDALKTYLWVLHQQTFGQKIVSVKGETEGEFKIADLVQDKTAAQNYFDKMGW